MVLVFNLNGTKLKECLSVKLFFLEKEMDLTATEDRYLCCALNAYTEVEAFYQDKIPLTDEMDKEFLELYFSYGPGPVVEKLTDLVRQYLEIKVERNLLKTDLIKNDNRLQQAIAFKMKEIMSEHSSFGME